MPEEEAVKVSINPPFSVCRTHTTRTTLMRLPVCSQDLRARIANYEAVYETVEDDEQLSYIKLINLQSKVICSRIYGKVAQKIVGFLMAIHTGALLSLCSCLLFLHLKASIDT